MQRWLIPRSSRVKVGRHSVSAQRKQTETEKETEAEAEAKAEAEVKSKTLSRKQFLQTVRQFYSFRVEKENKQTELVRFDLLSTEARFERISAAPSEIYKSLALYTTHIWDCLWLPCDLYSKIILNRFRSHSEEEEETERKKTMPNTYELVSVFRSKLAY